MDEDARDDPGAGEQPGSAEEASQQPDEPVEFRRGVDYLTTTTAPVDQFRPELDAPAARTDDQGGAQATPVDGGGDPGSE
jgi:hypothetical protein